MMVRATFTDGSRGVQRIVSAPMHREDFDGWLAGDEETLCMAVSTWC